MKKLILIIAFCTGCTNDPNAEFRSCVADYTYSAVKKDRAKEVPGRIRYCRAMNPGVTGREVYNAMKFYYPDLRVKI